MSEAPETRPHSGPRTPAEADANFLALKGDESVIPTGFYCYDRIGGWKQDDEESLPYYNIRTCPYWAIHPDKEEQESGYCALIGCGDWEENHMGILWDQVKSCRVRNEIPEGFE